MIDFDEHMRGKQEGKGRKIKKENNCRNFADILENAGIFLKLEIRKFENTWNFDIKIPELGIPPAPPESELLQI